MDGIKENIDHIIRPRGSKYACWHRKEIVCAEGITFGTLRQHGLFPDVRFGDIHTEINGQVVTMPKHRALIAEAHDGRVHPLHVCGNRYSIIQNEQVARTVSETLQGLDVEYKLACAGTLKGLKMFFISVELGDGGGITINGEEYHGYINFITSHDGSTVFVGHDNMFRAVCYNTVSASLRAKHHVEFKVRHSGDTEANCKKMSKFLQGVLTERQEFATEMEYFASTKVADTDIAPLVGGYFLNLAETQGKKMVEFSTRTTNAIDAIATLARTGRGNRGETLYDVFNGVTEYYTSGDGVGRNVDAGDKAFSSEFGTAAQRKREFGRYLIKGYEQAAEQASALLAN